MSDAPGTDAARADAPLPRRPPRPLAVHASVDAAVAFLVLIGPLWFLGVGVGAVLGVALVIGLVVAPWSRRRELDALARRPGGDDDASPR